MKSQTDARLQIAIHKWLETNYEQILEDYRGVEDLEQLSLLMMVAARAVLIAATDKSLHLD